jgi:hypothetical protein
MVSFSGISYHSSGKMVSFPGILYRFSGKTVSFSGISYHSSGKTVSFPGRIYRFPGKYHPFSGKMDRLYFTNNRTTHKKNPSRANSPGKVLQNGSEKVEISGFY